MLQMVVGDRCAGFAGDEFPVPAVEFLWELLFRVPSGMVGVDAVSDMV